MGSPQVAALARCQRAAVLAASSAAGVILLRALPAAAPVVFLYVMIAGTQPLPERLDWLFYLTTQSIVIVFTVRALVTAAFAPGAPRWLPHCRFGRARRAQSRTQFLPARKEPRAVGAPGS